MMDSQWRNSLNSSSALRIFAVSLLTLLFIVSYEASPSVVSAASWTDCSQALYVAMEGNGGGGTDVYRYDCNGNEIDRYATGFTGTSGLTIDAVGNMYISDDSPGIWKVTPSGVVTPIATNVTFQNPNGLYLDSTGRLLVADSGNSILRLTLDPATGNSTLTEILAQGFSNPQGVIEGATGTVLFTDTTGYIWQVTPTSTVPLVSPATGDRFHASQIASANQGHLAKDPSGNIYISDFGDRIIRISPDGATAVDVVNINPTTTCPAGQSGGTSPGFRGLVFTPDNSSLVATGYCKDNIYVFSVTDMDSAATSGTPVSTLPTPFTENPSAALDENINGPFGIAFFATNAVKPHIRSCVLPKGAPTWWVDTTFTGATSTGSSAQPFKTINQAVNQVATGTESIIKVRPGTYAEHVDVRKPRVHLRGEGPGSTIIDAGASGTNGFTYGADGITIGNFRISNGGSLNSGIGVFGPSEPEDVVICNNVLTGNAKAVGTGNSSPLIVNNTFYDNTFGVSLAGGSTSTIIRNNIFQGGATTTFGTGIDGLSGSTSTIDYNLYYNLVNNISGALLSCSVGCIFNVNPLLINPASGNYHLGSGSPAIDAGTAIGAPLDDFENDSRPIDGDANGSSIHDMGADEARSGKATIKGNKFNDQNGNSLNDGEPGLSGWTIYLDSNNNGILDSGEATTITDSLGNYQFNGVPVGTTTVREVAQSGWSQTFPTNYRADLRGGSQVSPVETKASGRADLEFVASTSLLMFSVSWNNLEGGDTTGLHIHKGAVGTNGSVIHNLAALAGASSTKFGSPVQGTTTLSSTDVTDLMAGNLYVNLHTAGHASGEIRGQIASSTRGWTINVSANDIVNNINFGNTQDNVVDNCSCIIGIFESDKTHDWTLSWQGATTSTITTKMKVAAVAVANGEVGTITVSIKDATGSTTTLTLSHPLVNGQETSAEMSLSLVPGQKYPFTVSHTGVAQHYKLGSKDSGLWMGQEQVWYLESPVQDWKIQATSSEAVTLVFNTDSPNNGANQTAMLKVSVYDIAGGALVHQATTTMIANTPWTVSVPATSTAKSYRVRIEPDGHFRVQKTSGPDRNFYIMACPKQETDDVGTIQGIKFNDLNGDGKMNSGEPGLAGWTIYHDVNKNGVRDSGEATATTDSNGNYELKDLPAGLQYIREEQKSGWKQTAPSQFGAMLSGTGEVPPTSSTAKGWASIDIDASSSKLLFEVTWMGLQGGTTTGLHIHKGSATSTGGVIVDLVAAAGASTTAFTSPVSGMKTLSTTVASDIASGGTYVNLHTSGFSSGEIRGQVTDTGRALVENIPSGGVVTGRNFGNMSTGEQPSGEDNCSCIIGIFESDQTHDWQLMWTGTATSSTVSTMLKVAAVSVNSSETGSIIVKIKDETGATTTITVIHPTVNGAENTFEQSLTLTPGKMYPFTVEYTGTAHHYKLGSKDMNLAIGHEEVRYLEAKDQNWMIKVDAGEAVTLTLTTDSTGPSQTSQYKITVRNASGTVVFAQATTTISMDTPQTLTIGTNSSTSSAMWIVTLEALNGHIRMAKNTGSDRYFYIRPCPDKGVPPDTGGGSPTPVPGVGTWGLIGMAGLMGAAFVWTVRRRRRATV